MIAGELKCIMIKPIKFLLTQTQTPGVVFTVTVFSPGRTYFVMSGPYKASIKPASPSLFLYTSTCTGTLLTEKFTELDRMMGVPSPRRLDKRICVGRSDRWVL